MCLRETGVRPNRVDPLWIMYPVSGRQGLNLMPCLSPGHIPTHLEKKEEDSDPAEKRMP